MELSCFYSLAKKGSVEKFKGALQAIPRPIPQDVLFNALRVALAWNQPEKARLLLDEGANPLAANEENSQLLTHAAISGGGELVDLMLKHGCQVNHKNNFLRTALHDAAGFGNTEGVKVLIKAGAEINCRDHQDQTPLIEALSNNRIETAMELVRSGAKVKGCFSRQGETPLMMAAARGAVELVRLLLKKRCDLEHKDFIGCTALMHGAKGGSIDVVRLLLDAGADKGVRDHYGKNPLQWASPLHPDVGRLLLGKQACSPGLAREAILKAALDGNMGMLKTLLSQNAIVQPREEGGESALVNALFQKPNVALALLLSHPRTEINYRSGKLLRTPLIVAVVCGEKEKVRLLLDHGADLSMPDADGRTAVNHAAMGAHREILALLFEKGASLNDRDNGGGTSLHQAIADTHANASLNARIETVRWLLSNGAHPNVTDNGGRTPLMLAAGNAYTEIAMMLFEAGASIDAMDAEGRTALAHALYFGTDFGYNERFRRPKSEAADKAAPVVRFLLEAGADPVRCDALSIASRWRWKGAKKVIISYIK